MLKTMPWANRDAVCRVELPHPRPADALAALEHAVHPRTFDSSERFTPLTELRQFHQAFDGPRFRFRCAIGRTVLMSFDVDGEVMESATGGTTIRMSMRVAHRRLRYLFDGLLLAWFGFFAWSSPYGIGFVLVLLYACFIYSWPRYARRYQEELEVRLRELGPFLRSRV